MSDPEICGSPSFSSDEGVDQWYECKALADHAPGQHDYQPIDARPAKADPPQE